MLNLALYLQVFISLCILDLQLFILLDFFFYFSKLIRVIIDLRSNLNNPFLSLLVPSSDLFQHLSLLPDHVLGRIYQSLAVPLAETDTARQSLLTELRRFDLDQRKLANLEEEQQRKVKQKKDELIDLQTNKGNRERLIESTKNMVR